MDSLHKNDMNFSWLFSEGGMFWVEADRRRLWGASTGTRREMMANRWTVRLGDFWWSLGAASEEGFHSVKTLTREEIVARFFSSYFVLHQWRDFLFELFTVRASFPVVTLKSCITVKTRGFSNRDVSPIWTVLPTKIVNHLMALKEESRMYA